MVLWANRTNGLVQVFSHPECSPPSVNDMYVGYALPISKPSHHMPHFSQKSPSRFCHQPVQWFNHMQSTSSHCEHIRPKGQPSPLSCIPASPHSRGTSTFASGIPWGTNLLQCSIILSRFIYKGFLRCVES